VVGTGFVESLGLCPNFPLATLIVLDDPSQAPNNDSSHTTQNVVREQAACALTYSYPSPLPVADDVFACLPTILPNAVPCILPPGIVGATSLGRIGMIAILHDLYYDDPLYTAWIRIDFSV
jgi:hypothetical protein